VNHETSAFLFKADVPVAADPGYTETEFYHDDDLPAPAPMPKLKAEKAISDVSLGAGQEDLDQAAELGLAPAIKQEPVRSQKVANRNDKVTVQYMDGSVKRDVKYKSVEEDLAAQRCVLVD
jgi:preprotein translocase subunit SecA